MGKKDRNKKGASINKSFVQQNEKIKTPSYIQMLKFSTKGDRFLMLLGTAAALASGAVDPLNRLFFGELTQSVIDYARNCSVNAQVCSDSTDAFMDAIAEFAYKNALIGVASLILLYVASETFNYTAIRQVFKVRSLYLKSLLNKDISWYDVNTSGDFASRMGDDLSKFEEGIGERIPLFLALQGSFISSLVLAIVKGWELALICVVSLPISITSTAIISFFITKLSKKELDAYGAAAAVAEEVLSSIRTVVAFGGQNKEKERYDSKLITARKCSDKKTFLQANFYGIYWFFILSSYGLAFWYGIKLMLSQRDWDDPVYTPGNMVTVFFSVMTGSQNFAIAAPFIELFAVAKSAGGKIFHIIESKPVVNLSKGSGEKGDGVQGNIKFSDVNFSYPSRNDVPILQGLNLEITAGETVALVGSSGCGKSTVLQLIQRFYDPNGGKVFVDGVDIRDLDLSWYRSFIGVVGQEPILFDNTIEENIKYGYPNATFEDVVAAAKKSNADNFINMLPNAYKTIVGERGAQLSGGQKQRIAIARALVRNPALLLLDEATSALDTNSEAKVQSALDSASKQCTTIIVAHRLSTIKGANKIVVLSKGSVVEQGTHEELMALKGEYHALVTTQAKSEELLEKNYQRESTEVEDEDSNIKLVKEELTDVDQDVDIFVKKASIWSIVKMNAPEWFYLIVGSIGAALMGCSMPIFAVIFGSILQVLENTDADYVRSETNKYCLYFVGAGGLAAVSTFLQMYMFGVAGQKLTLRLRSQMFEAMLRQEMGYFDRKTNGVGALCAQLSGEAAHVQGATGLRVSSIMNSMTGLVLAVVLSVYYQWKLGLVALGFFPVMIGAMFLQRQMSFGENEEYRISLQKSTKVAVEAVGNIRTVASLGCEEVFYQIYVEELLPHIKRSIKGTHGRAFILGLSKGLSFFAYATCMYYGGYLIKGKEVEYGDVYKVCQALIMGTNSIANSLAFTPNMDKGLRAAKNIMNLLNRVPKIKDNPEAVDKTSANGNVEYSNISFSYPTREDATILNGLELNVLQGKTVALVGSSGCGKSTIVQLLERFYDPTSGKVSLDGDDLKKITLSSLRSHLGIVSQEPNLFSKTIGDNIAYGDNSREIDEGEIIEAAKKANIHNFISSLPLGYNTKLGEKGTQLSGGQKQRIAIARALVRNPKVLLLDEATSALDTESEKVVQEALDNAKQGRTCITIAHRLSTIQDADLICVIDGGKVAEKGTHHDLLEKRGLYFKLHTLQHK